MKNFWNKASSWCSDSEDTLVEKSTNCLMSIVFIAGLILVIAGIFLGK